MGNTCFYDCLGQRVQTSVTASGSTTYRTMVYDLFGQDVAEYSGSTGATLERENFYRGGLLATYETSGSSLKYILQDVQGSTRAVVNNSQGSSAVIARHDFLPFGEEIGSNIPTGYRTSGQGYGVTDGNRQKYALMERDDTSGLDHTWWRKYENISGRWTSSDPYSGSISLDDPQSTNRFSYTRNDPVNLVDPNGLEWVEKCELWTWVNKATGEERGPRFTICHHEYVFNIIPVGGMTFGDGAGLGGSNNGVNNTLSFCSSIASVAQYQNVNPAGTAWKAGLNGQWNSMSWGGNGATGARATAITRASTLGLVSKTFGTLGAGLSAYESANAFRNGDKKQGTLAAVDAGFSVAGAFGGPYGAAASGLWFGFRLIDTYCPGISKGIGSCGRECRRK